MIVLLVLPTVAGCGTGIYEDFADGIYAFRHPVFVSDGVDEDRVAFDLSFFNGGFATDPYFFDPGPYWDDYYWGDYYADDGFYFDEYEEEGYFEDDFD